MFFVQCIQKIHRIIVQKPRMRGTYMKKRLLMLISALYDREHIMDAYKVAINENYRFFSFGDAMFIE